MKVTVTWPIKRWNGVVLKSNRPINCFYTVQFPWRHPHGALVMTVEYMRRSGYVKYKADINDDIKRHRLGGI